MLGKGAPLSEWLTWLESLSPSEVNLGLARVERMLQRLKLGFPPHLLLVAGTNGKGSSVAMAKALLENSGHRVGVYTSPHLVHYNERIVVAGEPATDDLIISAFERVEAHRDDLALTYFEYGTLAAAVIFADARLDAWILEVGLGGRLDATNAFTPTASLITNIALDHCDWLGDNVEMIGYEKAGVMRPGVTTVFGDNAMPQSVEDHAREIGARLLRSGGEFGAELLSDGGWHWHGPNHELRDLKRPGLEGDFQIGNAAAVLALLDATGLLNGMNTRSINAILPHVKLDGRSDRRIVDGVEWYLDVAHNPQAAEALANALADEGSAGDRIGIIGILNDKDVDGVIEPLLPCVDRWIAITAESARAVPASDLATRIAALSNKPCLEAESIQQAVEFARRKATENDKILVAGSFFTVAPVLNILAAESLN